MPYSFVSFLYQSSFFPCHPLVVIILSLPLFQAMSSTQTTHLQLFFPSSSFLCVFVSHHLPFISPSPTISHISLDCFCPTLSLSQSQRPRGSQQWIITHFRNSALLVLLAQLVVGLGIVNLPQSPEGKSSSRFHAQEYTFSIYVINTI